MADIIGTRDQVDEYIGSRLVVAAYQGSRKYFDAYSDVTGNLPLYFNSRVNHNLRNYRLYGTENGAGAETSGAEPAGYKIPLTVTSGETENLFDKNATDTSNGYVSGYRMGADGGTATSAVSCISEYIEIQANTVYTAADIRGRYNNDSLCFYNANKEYISGDAYGIANAFINKTFTTPSTAKYVRFSLMLDYFSDVMLVPGSTAPDHYIPHRYTADYNLYIGSTKLGAEEYVDYAEQKIYKMDGGVLTPTDPPSPLSAITAYEGENTLSSTETVGEVTLTGRLAKTYRQVEYLESTGTQYIETNIVPTYSDAVETYLQFTAPRKYPAKQGVLGTIYDNRRYAIVLGLTEENPLPVCFYCGYPWQTPDTNIQITASVATLTQKQRYYISTTKFQLGTESKTPPSVSQSPPQKTFLLFGMWDNDGVAYPFAGFETMRCFGLTFSVAGVITHNLIPVERNSDGALGMLDTITNKFYTNAGTGTFVKGGYV